MADKYKIIVPDEFELNTKFEVEVQKVEGEPPVYPCPHCSMEFGSQEELDTHISEEHPQFICPECSMEFSSQEELDTHMAEQHPPAPIPPLNGDLVETDVFWQGMDGYQTFRIPSVVIGNNGAIFAFAEGRKAGGSSGNVDIVLRRSLDGGLTWLPLQVIWSDGVNSCTNPCAFFDASTGGTWLLMCHNLNGDTYQKIVDGSAVGTRTVWRTYSTDGINWPSHRIQEITDQVKTGAWTWYATGPGIFIQNPPNYRFIAPCNHIGHELETEGSHLIYSDNYGYTWHIGGKVDGWRSDEGQAVVLSDGKILLNMRNEGTQKKRILAESSDNGVNLSNVRYSNLIEPTCQASIFRYDAGRILFSNPTSIASRENLAVRLSYDDCQTWAISKMVYSGKAAYSCLTRLADGRIGLLYEWGNTQDYEKIKLATFSMANLES